MHIGLNRDWLNEYYTYSLSGRDDDVHGIKISESEALEIAVLISELDFSCVAVINKSQIETRDHQQKPNFCIRPPMTPSCSLS